MYLCFFSCSILCYILLFLKPKDFQLTAQMCYRYSGLFLGGGCSESSLYGRGSLLYRNWKGLIWFCSLPYMWSRLDLNTEDKERIKEAETKENTFWWQTAVESQVQWKWKLWYLVLSGCGSNIISGTVCALVRTVGLTAVLFSWTFAKPGSITFL